MTNTQVLQVIYPVSIKLTHISIQQQLQEFLCIQLTALDTLGFPSLSLIKQPISVFSFISSS
jgi:hypothetical protein